MRRRGVVYENHCDKDKSELYGGQPGWYARREASGQTGVANDEGRTYGQTHVSVICGRHFEELSASERGEWEKIEDP